MTDDLPQLLPRIYAALDEHRFDDLAGYYTPTVRAVTPGGVLAGHEALIAQATRNHAGIPAIQHLVTGLLIDDDDEGGADLRANVVAVFAGEDRVPTFELGGVWRGRAQRDARGWRIAEFTITPTWTRGTRPAATTAPDDEGPERSPVPALRDATG